MTLYSSVDYAISIRGTVQQGLTSTTMDRVRLYKKLKQVSQRIDHKLGANRPIFAPYQETRKFPLDPTRVSSWLGTFAIDPLLALTSMTVGGNAVTAVEGYPDSAMPPFNRLRLTDCCTGWYGYCPTDPYAPQQVGVNGLWGFHTDYAHAWLQVDTLTAAITDTTTTTFTVTDTDGDDAYGQPNRISPGHLLKIDDEFFDVTDDDGTTVTAIRGANGSTTATHLINAPVYRWEVMEDVQLATARQALLMYAREGAFTTVEVQGLGTEVRYPNDWLSEVLGVLQEYANG